jgi:hypothetical protein
MAKSKTVEKTPTKKVPKKVSSKKKESKPNLVGSNSKIRKKRRNDEDNLQIKCVNYMRKTYPSVITRSTLAGACIGAKQGFKRKEMGNVAGFPDLEILEPSAPYNALYIELKTKIGKLSKVQKEVIAKLNDKGYKALMVNDFDVFKTVVKKYLNK